MPNCLNALLVSVRFWFSSLTWAYSPREAIWWDIDRLESKSLFLFCSFSSLISFSALGLGWVSTVTAKFPFCLLLLALEIFQGSQGRCLLECRSKGSPVPARLPGDHTGGTRGLSQPSFACAGLALCGHKEFLLVTQLWHYPRSNSCAIIFFSLSQFVAALSQKGEAFQNITRDLI